MKKPHIIMTFNPDGTVTSEAHDFTGKTCDKALKMVSDMLDAKPDNIKRKPEYFAKEALKVKA